MARPKEFDRDEALEKALEVFWKHGYQGTSVQALVDNMGINRGSLYDTFGDKHALFLEAMKRYERTALGNLLAALAAPASAREAIRHVFEQAAETAATCPHRRGCLMTNAAVELAPHDPACEALVAQELERMEDAFCRVVARGQAEGELDAGRDARALARFLTNSLQGLRVTGKAVQDPARLADIVAVTLDAVW